MKRRFLVLSAALAIAATALTGCSAESASDSESTESTGLTIKYVINGTLGDKSFIDSAARGLAEAEELGYTVKTVELGYDESTWESGLADAAAGEDTANLRVVLTGLASNALRKVSADRGEMGARKTPLCGADWARRDSNTRRLCQQIYSLPPLSTWVHARATWQA